MVSRLRKLIVVVFTLLVMLSGAFGWAGSASSASASQGPHTTHHLLARSPNAITCPPPPYEC